MNETWNRAIIVPQFEVSEILKVTKNRYWPWVENED